LGLIGTLKAILISKLKSVYPYFFFVEITGIMTSLDAIHLLADTVKGFLDPVEGERLYQVAGEVAAMGPCLEIGSYCGKSALYLGAACKAHGAVLFSIDHHRGSEEHQPGEAYFDPDLFDPQAYQIDTFTRLRHTLQRADLEDTVVPLVSASAVAARAWCTPLSLVFIDGGHAYDTVSDDATLWARHLMPDGYLLIHDIFSDPAQGGQAPYQIYQKVLSSGNFTACPMTKSLGVLRFVAP
jgi:MMP 1-O-methyltransferase